MIAWDTIKLQRMITSACLSNIAKYTDREDYELIFVDQENARGIDSLDYRHHRFAIDKYVPVEKNIGCSAAFNLGYKNSNPDYPNICFVHSDVFVPDNWLKKLLVHLRERIVVMPTQGMITRDQVVESYTNPNLHSWDDAGMCLMTKKDFEQSGGWDERFKAIYPEGIFRMRIPRNIICPSDVIITHLGGIGYYHDGEFERRKYVEEEDLFNKIRDEMKEGVPQPRFI